MAFTAFPGGVTSGMVGSTFQAMTPEGERRMYELEDEKKREREEANAKILADRAAQEKAAQQAAEREKVRGAFNQLYGQQMRNAYHDQMVMSEGVSGTGVPSKGLGMAPGGQSRFSSGNMKPWSEPGSFTPPGGWYELPQGKLNTALDNMWRMATDPYMKAAGQLMQPGLTTAGGAVGGSNPYAWNAIHNPGGGGGGEEGSRKKKITTKEQAEQPGGIDWQKSSGGGPGEFQYDLFGGR